ncbi:glycosyltransferase [Candidatus Micrarchaeota archaeon]|nr:glycosyltransferase [Candidatus Micrarchaeota archaeon]
MKLSVIVPALNEEKIICHTLRELKKRLPKGTQIVVADGKSTDGTAALARKYADVVYERGRDWQAASIAAGRNAGARKAKGDIFLFNDADTLPQKEFVDKALEILRMQPDVVSVGCVVRPDVSDWNTQLFFSILNGIVRVSTAIGRPVIAGNCVFYRADAFWKVHGFDEDMHASEDQDLSLRVSKIGRVVLLTQYTAYTSNRRLQQMGFLGLLNDWGHTTVNFLLGKKTKRYAIVREIT